MCEDRIAKLIMRSQVQCRDSEVTLDFSGTSV